MAIGTALIGEAGARVYLGEAHAGLFFLIEGERNDGVGWADLAAVIAGWVAAGEVGVGNGCPEAVQAMLEAGRLKKIGGADA